MAVRPRERGTLSQIRSISLSKPLIVLWAIQAIVYWGAMSALPKLYRIWTPATKAETFQLEVLLLLYIFEIIGIVSAAFSAIRFGIGKTLLWYSVLGSGLVLLTTGSIAINAAWFLAASVCGMFACLTPLWGILFVITTETFPVQCRATGLGLMMSTRICQGILELTLPDEFNSASWVPVAYSGIAAVMSCVGVFVVSKHLKLPEPPSTTNMRSNSNNVVKVVPHHSHLRTEGA
jgi:hypothetical protein